MSKANKLKNYGRSLLEMMEGIPQEVKEDISGSGYKIIGKHLDPKDLEHFSALFSMEKERMTKHDFSDFHEKTAGNEEFLSQQIEWAASYSAMCEMVGKEKAMEIHNEIAAQTYPKLFSMSFPSPADLSGSNDPFNEFKEWFSTLMEANKRAGIHDFEIVEATRDLFQINCTRCAWNEIYKQLGVRDACMPICRVDDIFFPDFCHKAGIRYSRSGTLAAGNEYCDYRFERPVSSD